MLLSLEHLFTCIFILIGKIEHYKGIEGNWIDVANLFDASFFKLYTHSFYFINTTVLAVGYGDATAKTFPEIFYVLFVEIIGVFYFNYIVSKMVALIASPSRNLRISQYKNAVNSLVSMDISEFGKEQLLNYYQFEFDTQYERALFHSSMKEIIPFGLQKKIMTVVNYSIYSRLQFLENASDETIEKVAMALKPKILMPGDFLAKAGRINKNIYFLTEGTVDMLSAGGDFIQRFTSENNSVFGETSVIRRIPEVCSVIAVSYVEVYELSQKDLSVIFDLGIHVERPNEF
ncbi:cation channel family protein [Histomonas meleagridis]|uniref:cation channel family protein n=1 Tax=Histomonas meleagridis TaxID=135588 RepID=UPI00355A596D|nr:cation channel family protein [Histomonas meleagridis]KAH0797560.1 cation channel family protein [Histomonas meleagridis]